MIVFAVEPFASVYPEIVDHWRVHYDEAAEDQQAIPFDMSVDRYQALDNDGHLLIVTARRADALVGYIFALVGAHLHCQSVMQAVVDLIYLDRSCRGGRTSMRHFQAFEAAARARGVARMLIEMPIARDQGRLLARLGCRTMATTYSKLIGSAA